MMYEIQKFVDFSSVCGSRASRRGVIGTAEGTGTAAGGAMWAGYAGSAAAVGAGVACGYSI